MSSSPETNQQTTEQVPAVKHHVSLLALLRAFGMIGLTSFGGARAAYFRHEIVVSRKWLSDPEFLEGLTISQTLPGPNVGNLSVYLGHRMRGPIGAAIALLAFIMPGAVAILLLAVFGFGHEDLPAIHAVFLGVGAAAVGLSAATTMQIGIRGVHHNRDWVIVAVTFASIALLRLPLLFPLLVIAPVSIWFWRPKEKQEA